MVEDLTLPDLPVSEMYVNGKMTIEWQEFFRGLFNRVGAEPGTSPLPDVVTEMISGVYDIPRNYAKEINEVLNLFWSRPTEKNYDKRLDDLEKAVYCLDDNGRLIVPAEIVTAPFMQGKEPFKYYLPQTVWDDLRTPANNTKKVPGKEAKDFVYNSGVILNFEVGQDQAIAFNVQLPHAYKLGANIEFHAHVILPTSGAGLGAENIKFDFTHAWADLASVVPGETTVPTTIDVQSYVADTHYLMEIAATIDGSGISGVSSMLICSLTRDVGVANNYNDDVYVVEVDFHYPIDTIGSRLEASK